MSLSPSERSELLEAYRELRVTDVRDGLDTLLLHDSCSMSPSIRPVFRIRACGMARTAKYLPFDGTVPRLSPEEYWDWVGEYYRTVCPYPWMEGIQPGDFCVIDQSGVDCGLMGSNNTLNGIKAGARGFVTNGGVRDTDELILQKVPFWSPFISQTMVQGRLKYDSMDIPVSVGGVTVNPGDVVVADGDGVVVVPQKLAKDVAKWADEERRRDRAERRKLYQSLKMTLDMSTEEEGRTKKK